jgi:hypothetical protein
LCGAGKGASGRFTLPDLKVKKKKKKGSAALTKKWDAVRLFIFYILLM